MSIETKKVSTTGVGAGAAIAIKPFNDVKAVIVAEVVGTATYAIQYSLDGVFYIALNGNTALTASSDATVVMPVHSVRANITSGTGTVHLTVRQTDGKFEV